MFDDAEGGVGTRLVTRAKYAISFLSIGQGRAPFLPMPFLCVAATMRVRGVGGIVVEVIVFFVFFFGVEMFWYWCWSWSWSGVLGADEVEVKCEPASGSVFL